jgi:hypothetical protein
MEFWLAIRIFVCVMFHNEDSYTGQLLHATGHASLATTFPVPTRPQRRLLFFFTQLHLLFFVLLLLLFRTGVLQVDESKHCVCVGKDVGVSLGF